MLWHFSGLISRSRLVIADLFGNLPRIPFSELNPPP